MAAVGARIANSQPYIERVADAHTRLDDIVNRNVHRGWYAGGCDYLTGIIVRTGLYRVAVAAGHLWLPNAQAIAAMQCHLAEMGHHQLVKVGTFLGEGYQLAVSPGAAGLSRLLIIHTLGG